MAEKDGFIYSDHHEHRAGRDNGGINWEVRDKITQQWHPAGYSQIPRKLRDRAEREFGPITAERGSPGSD